jgi:hypothetical protein
MVAETFLVYVNQIVGLKRKLKFAATAWCLRSHGKLRQKDIRGESLSKYFTASDLAISRTTLIRLVQTHAFFNEMLSLKAGPTLPKRNKL